MRVGPTYPGIYDDSEGDERAMTAQYICIKTASAAGPDNNAVYPKICTGERKCFKEI